MKKYVEQFRNGIFLAPSRATGETYMEPIMRKYLNLSKVKGKKYDALDKDGKKVEIKSSKVLVTRVKYPSLVERIMSESEENVLTRLIPFADCYVSEYDANFQNIKRDHFDKLLYILLFEDCIKIFKSKSEDIKNIGRADGIGSRWSGKHGLMDKVGKNGQFAIKKNNIKWHLENNLVATLTWEEVYKISEGIILK